LRSEHFDEGLEQEVNIPAAPNVPKAVFVMKLRRSIPGLVSMMNNFSIVLTCKI